MVAKGALALKTLAIVPTVEKLKEIVVENSGLFSAGYSCCGWRLYGARNDNTTRIVARVFDDLSPWYLSLSRTTIQ